MSNKKKKDICHYQVRIYEQYSLFDPNADFVSNPSSVISPSVTYVSARDPIINKEVLHMTLNDLVDNYLDLKKRYNKLNLILARINDLRQNYKTRLNVYEEKEKD